MTLTMIQCMYDNGMFGYHKKVVRVRTLKVYGLGKQYPESIGFSYPSPISSARVFAY